MRWYFTVYKHSYTWPSLCFMNKTEQGLASLFCVLIKAQRSKAHPQWHRWKVSEVDWNFHLTPPSLSGAFSHIWLPLISGTERTWNRQKGSPAHRTYLHGTRLFIGASLSCYLKAVGHSFLRRPVGRRQLFHEVLQADDPMVGPEGLQLEVLLVGHMQL